MRTCAGSPRVAADPTNARGGARCVTRAGTDALAPGRLLHAPSAPPPRRATADDVRRRDHPDVPTTRVDPFPSFSALLRNSAPKPVHESTHCSGSANAAVLAIAFRDQEGNECMRTDRPCISPGRPAVSAPSSGAARTCTTATPRAVTSPVTSGALISTSNGAARAQQELVRTTRSDRPPGRTSPCATRAGDPSRPAVRPPNRSARAQQELVTALTADRRPGRSARCATSPGEAPTKRHPRPRGRPVRNKSW